MKVILAALVCALAVQTVMLMPVAEPGSEPLPVVPLEKSSAQHVLRRETVETAPAPTPTEHKENETPEAHKAHEHQHQQVRLVDRLEEVIQNVEKKEEKKEEAKPAEEKKEIILDEKKELPEKDEKLKSVAAEAVPESIAPVEAPVAAPAPVESKVGFY